MINEKEILKELDERIEFQGIIVEHSYTGNRSGNAAYEQGRFDEIKALRDFIKTKSAHGVATPMSTDINSLTQETVYHKKSGMSEEFLINCDTKIIEAGLCLALGYNETGEKKLIEVSHMMLKRVIDSVTPMTNHMVPHMIAILRYVADALEEESDDNTKKVVAIAEKMIKALEIDFGKEEVNETNNEES